MTTIVFIFLIVLVFVIYQIAALVLTIRETRRLREIRQRAQTQATFGRRRHELMKLAASGDLDTNSVTFLNFYTMFTYVMRNPDHYNAIARYLQNSFFNETIHDTESRTTLEVLARERLEWSEDVKEMAIQTSEAIRMLMVFHSPTLRTVFLIANGLRKIVLFVVRRELGLLAGSARLIAQVSPVNQTLYKAKYEIRELAST